MTTEHDLEMEVGGSPAPSLIDALLVYAEPLVADAHAVVLGDADGPVPNRLLELGARSVSVFDPDPARAASASRTAPRGVTVRALVDELDVRDGAFDVAVVPDLSELNAPREMVARLRRAVARDGAVVAMGRAKVAELDAPAPFEAELGPASLEYAELYDLFAVVFEDVALAGVVPFDGVVFAELGRDDDEASAVSVDTRFAPRDPPSVFAVVARVGTTSARPLHAREPLDPYAIVQTASAARGASTSRAAEGEIAAVRLKAELLSSQLDAVRERVLAADHLQAEARSLLERTVLERDGALTRAMELEAVLAAAQQAMGTLERRLLSAEQGLLERDDRIAALSATRESRRSDELVIEPNAAEVISVASLAGRLEHAEAALAVALAELAIRDAAAREVAARERESVDSAARLDAVLAELRERAERAESIAARGAADLSLVGESHALETAEYEEQLRDRARFIASLEKELVRREQLVKQLVASLEASASASHESHSNGLVFEAAAPLSVPVRTEIRPDPAVLEENVRLRSKLDDLASDVARREGELQARGWRITELENQLAAVLAEQTKLTHASPLAVESPDARGAEPREPGARDADARLELARAQNELDALRQALAQEHAARVAAESGEELSRARSELAKQSALLEQMRGRLETA